MKFIVKKLNLNDNVEWFLSGKSTETHIELETENKKIKYWMEKSNIINLNEIDFSNTGEEITFAFEELTGFEKGTIVMKNGKIYLKERFIQLKNGNFMSKFGSKKIFLNLENIERIN